MGQWTAATDAGRSEPVDAEAAKASMRSDCFVVGNIAAILLEIAGESLLQDWWNGSWLVLDVGRGLEVPVIVWEM